MKAKPDGAKYRNLVARGESIYYERLWKGRRIVFSTKTNDWGEAASVRDLYEEKLGIGRRGVALRLEAPRFGEFAKRYLLEDTARLARTTKREREHALAEAGEIVGQLGALRLDTIDEPALRAWWAEAVDRRELAIKTGRNLLDAIAGVFAFARELGLVDANPVDGFRQTLSRRTRTKRGRAESAPGRDVRPIEQPAELAKLVAAARGEGLETHVHVLLLVDAGLRMAEALGLRWGAVTWGDDEEDRRRCLLIDTSRPRGGEAEAPKSGRARRVQLSRRLRGALFALYRQRERPKPDAYVLRRPVGTFRNVVWPRILQAADIGHWRPKDLRDTFASQLLSAGVQLGYVSTQLGHSDFGVTVKHYAKWVGGDEYRAALVLEPGEVPADLLARLAESHQSPNTPGDAAQGLSELERATARDLDAFDDAESYTDQSRLVAGTGFEPARPRRR